MSRHSAQAELCVEKCKRSLFSATPTCCGEGDQRRKRSLGPGTTGPQGMLQAAKLGCSMKEEEAEGRKESEGVVV